jgi:ATP-dependent DNA helicase PIF1
MRTKFITGQAGTGKTYQLKQRMLTDEGLILCATTGIASLNLGEGVTTLNSYLKYFDYESLKEKFESGALISELKQRVEKERLSCLAVDEVSMLDGRMLDFITEAMGAVEELTNHPLELILTGDFCQLPPVKAPWAFEANNWNRFAEDMEKLTKIWRQTDLKYIEALNCFRAGKGAAGAQLLSGVGEIEWSPRVDTGFEGTTIMAKNAEVDAHNARKLALLPGKLWNAGSFRWAANPEHLKNWTAIPQAVSVKPEALIMLRANDTEEWQYANGSLAKVIEYNEEKKCFHVKLLSTGAVVDVYKITRKVYSKEVPKRFEKLKEGEWPTNSTAGRERGEGMDYSYWDLDRRGGPRWCVGEVTFYPMQLAWATTVHRSQGLTLDKVQIDLGPANQNWHFMGSPAMVYVSLSRVKSPTGLRIIGNPSLLARRCKVDPKVVSWL